MKRSFLIIVGIVVVIALMAVWVYVLFFKTTPPPDTFSNLNLGNTTDSSFATEEEDILGEPLLDITSQERLRQLTTDPVAGFQEVELEGVSGFQVYYLTLGTGHIYHINLETGEEKRVSATTLPTISRGEISVDGNFVLIQAGFGSNRQVILGTLSSTTDELTTDSLGADVVDFKSTKNNTFFYLVRDGVGLVGKEYFPISKTSEELFKIPFTEAVVSWGESADGPHYIYPKPSNKLEGPVYIISNKNLKRLPMRGWGVSVVGNGDYVLKSELMKGRYSTHLYSGLDGGYTKTSLVTMPEKSLVTIPEKCAVLNDSLNFICASEDANLNEALPDSWYKGDISFSDKIWKISAKTGSTTLLSSIELETGRQVDVINPKSGLTENNIYFQNKNDQTLWLYELPREDINESNTIDGQEEVIVSNPNNE